MADEIVPVNEDIEDKFEDLSDEEFLALEQPGDVEDELPSTDPVPSEPEGEGDQPDPEGVDDGLPDGSPANPAPAPTKGQQPAAVSGEPSEEPDYAELYKQVMKPFKANGKEFTPSSPDEAVRLMQMGANYTKKMQALQPNLKLMRMLENNGLLDENKLAFLIDLDRKDPTAISKLLHDGKIDPLDLDVSKEPAYTPGQYTVTDQEMAFNDVLGNVMTTTTGKETVSHINTKWDKTSKEAIYREPTLLAIIDEQRANGIYDRISAEVERQQVLGAIPPMPFIEAYKMIGDKLHNAGLLAPVGSRPVTQVSPAPAATPTSVPGQPVLLETRPGRAKSPSINSDKARAVAAPPRSGKTPSPAGQMNPFTMTDAEIMAITELKV